MSSLDCILIWSRIAIKYSNVRLPRPAKRMTALQRGARGTKRKRPAGKGPAVQVKQEAPGEIIAKKLVCIASRPVPPHATHGVWAVGCLWFMAQGSSMWRGRLTASRPARGAQGGEEGGRVRAQETREEAEAGEVCWGEIIPKRLLILAAPSQFHSHRAISCRAQNAKGAVKGDDPAEMERQLEVLKVRPSP